MFDISILSKCAKEIGTNILNTENLSNANMDIADAQKVQGRPSVILQKALDSEFNSQSELNAKKVMAAALIVAKKNGLLPMSISSTIDPTGVASIADESISVMKVATKVATGQMDANKGIDILVDKATARAIAISDKLVEKGVDIAVKKLSVAVVVACPPAAPLVACIKSLQPVIEEKSKQLVRKGIEKISAVAKTVAKKFVEKVRESVTEVVKSPSKRILSILGI